MKLWPRSLWSPSQDTKAPEGESVKFITKVKGEPAPEVMWFHDNQPIKDDDIYHIIAGEEGEVTLELPEVFPEDAGVYTVKAVNEHGEVSGEAVLTVLTGNEHGEVSGEAVLTVLTGKMFELVRNGAVHR